MKDFLILNNFIAVYAASKNFRLNFSLSLATELMEEKNQVSVLCPGDVLREFQENSGLSGVNPQNALSEQELAKYTYDEFMNKGSLEIIQPKAKETIDQLNKSGNKSRVSNNLLFFRKQLAATLVKIKKNRLSMFQNLLNIVFFSKLNSYGK